MVSKMDSLFLLKKFTGAILMLWVFHFLVFTSITKIFLNHSTKKKYGLLKLFQLGSRNVILVNYLLTMSEFYKELKELRESQKISLEEISERTKINVQYLQDIENGAFEDIETPYLRLFLRAYTEEIGVNSQRALEQLDSFSGNKKAPLTQANILHENTNFELKKFIFKKDYFK